MVIVFIDENKLQSEVRYEDGDNCGKEYLHVYGLINNDAVIKVLPFLTNEVGVYINNPEFIDIQEK